MLFKRQALTAIVITVIFSSSACNQQESETRQQAPSSSAATEKKIGLCSTEMDGLSLTVEFFQERSLGENPSHQINGHYIQTIAGFSGAFPAAALRISEMAQSLTLEMSVVDAPDVPFAKFDLPMVDGVSQIDIYAINMQNRKWGNFSCQYLK